MGILQEIVAKRRERILAQGHTLGAKVPEHRAVQIAPFGQGSFLVAEIKRRSPSKGWLAPDLDAAAQARAYAAAGVTNVSVLTEEDHFAGSLEDLMAVKAALPQAAVLRKDFLLDEEDVTVSYRAGADAVLLIASVLSRSELSALHAKALSLGMAALVEVHDEADINKVRDVRPPLVGVNCRDLTTFQTDLLTPVRMRSRIDWPTGLVFESGIRGKEDAVFALGAGFSGLLVGESLVKFPALIGELKDAFREQPRDFWPRLFAGQRPGRPLVKICGIAREADARLAAELGADALGFVFAPSPRRAERALLEKLADVKTPKVAVVVNDAETASTLLADGLIDAVQFHGQETPKECFATAFPYYKAIRVTGERDVDGVDAYRCPRVLVDAGASGNRVSEALVARAKEKRPLWLAGGLGPANVRDAIVSFHPELIDASSGLEREPGKKDPELMKAYFREVERGATA